MTEKKGTDALHHIITSLFLCLSLSQVEEVDVLLGDRSKFDINGPYIGGVKCMKVRDQFDEEGIYTLAFNTKGNDQNPSVPLCVGQTL